MPGAQVQCHRELLRFFLRRFQREPPEPTNGKNGDAPDGLDEELNPNCVLVLPGRVQKLLGPFSPFREWTPPASS
jgi:hypothetical protein